MARIITCADCGEKKKHCSKGLCQKCYSRSNRKNRPVSECRSCKRKLNLNTNRLCDCCKGAWLRLGKPDLNNFHYKPTRKRRYEYPFPCKGCGAEITHGSWGKGHGRFHAGKGFCDSCKSFISRLENKGLEVDKNNLPVHKSRSNDEKVIYYWLAKFYKEENVWREYSFDKYPYPADFYISTTNTIIEFNGFWTHGKEPYNSSNIEHQKILKDWKSKASRGSSGYKQAIRVWTESDPEKRKTAKENGVTHLEFWSKDLTDFFRWLAQENNKNFEQLWETQLNTQIPQSLFIHENCTSCGDNLSEVRKGLRGMCGSCYQGWRKAGMPHPVQNFRFVPERHKEKPKRCFSCGDKNPNGRGLCSCCYASWKSKGKPEPIESFKHIPMKNRLSNKDKICISCNHYSVDNRGLCVACYQAWLKNGKPYPIENFKYIPQKLRTKPNCISCEHSKAERSNNLCSNCYAAWKRQGCPDLETFKYIPMKNRVFNKDKECSSCGRKPCIARGLCLMCYYAWRIQGKPEPVSEYKYTSARIVPEEYKYHNLSNFPSFDKGVIGVCGACGRNNVKHHERGMCQTCYTAWRKNGHPQPVSKFRYTPNSVENNKRWIKYPINCSSCNEVINNQKEHGAYGLCVRCYASWKRNNRPQPVSKFRHTPKLPYRRYPTNCSSCNKTINNQKEHGGFGLCKTCFTAWKREGCPKPITNFKYISQTTTVIEYPTKCTSCNCLITNQKQHGAFNLCIKCYGRWFRIGKPQPVYEFRYTPQKLRVTSLSANK